MADRTVKLSVHISDDGTLSILDQVGKKLADLGPGAEAAGRKAESGFGGFSRAVITANQALELLKKGAELAHEGVDLLLARVEQADRIGKLSQQIGIAVKDLTALSVSAQLADLDIETMARSMGIFASKLAAGDPQLKAIGVTSRDTNTALRQMASAFAVLPDGIEKSTVAREAFGRGGLALIPLLNAGTAALDEQAASAAALGVVYGDQFAKDSETFNDTLKLIKIGAEGVGTSIAEKLLPGAQHIASAVLDWEKANRQLIATDIVSWIDDANTHAQDWLTTIREIVSYWNVLPDIAKGAIIGGVIGIPGGLPGMAVGAAAGAGIGAGKDIENVTGFSAWESAQIEANRGLRAGTSTRAELAATGTSPMDWNAKPPVDTAMQERLRAAQSKAGDAAKEAAKEQEKAAKNLAELDQARISILDTQSQRLTDQAALAAKQLAIDDRDVDFKHAGADVLAEHVARLQQIDELQRQALTKRSEALDLEIQIKQQEAGQAVLQGLQGPEAAKALAEVAKLQAEQAKVTGELQLSGHAAQDFTKDIEKARLTTVNLADTVSTSLGSAFDAILTRQKNFSIGDLVKGTGEKIAQEIAGGFIKSQLAKNEFDAKLTDNFSVTLPGIFKTGADAMVSIFDWAFGAVSDSAESSFSGVASSATDMASKVAGAFRNSPDSSGASISNLLGLAGGTTSTVGGVTTAVDAYGSMFQGANAGAVNSAASGAAAIGAASGVAAAVPLIGAATMLYTQIAMKDPLRVGSAAGGGIGGGMAAGAVYGSVVPVLGTFIGAVLGGIMGLINGQTPTVEHFTDKAAGDALSKAGVPTAWGRGDKGAFGRGASLGSPFDPARLGKMGAPESQSIIQGSTAPEEWRQTALSVGNMLAGTGNFAGEVLGNTLINNARALGESEKQTKADLMALASSMNLDLFSGVKQLNTQLLEGKITQDAYGLGVSALAKLFSDDLPPGVDAAAIALANMDQQQKNSIVNVADFNKALSTQASIFDSLQSTLEGGVTSGIAAYISAASQALPAGGQYTTTSGGAVIPVTAVVTRVEMQAAARESLAASIEKSVQDGAVTALSAAFNASIADTDIYKQFKSDLAGGVNAAVAGNATGAASAFLSAQLDSVDLQAKMLPALDIIAKSTQGLLAAAGVTPTALRAEASDINAEIARAKFGLLNPRQQRAFEEGELARARAELAAGGLTPTEVKANLEKQRAIAEYFIGLGDKKDVARGLAILNALPAGFNQLADVMPDYNAAVVANTKALDELRTNLSGSNVTGIAALLWAGWEARYGNGGTGAPAPTLPAGTGTGQAPRALSRTAVTDASFAPTIHLTANVTTDGAVSEAALAQQMSRVMVPALLQAMTDPRVRAAVQQAVR